MIGVQLSFSRIKIKRKLAEVAIVMKKTTPVPYFEKDSVKTTTE